MHVVRNKNFDTVLKFELLYNLLLSLVVLPLIKLLGSLIMRDSGLLDLMPAHLLSYGKTALSIVGLLLIFLLITCATVWEMSALHLIYLANQKEQRLGLSNLFFLTFQHSRPFFHNFNPLFFLYTALLLSLSGVIYENPLLYNAEFPLGFLQGANTPTIVIGLILILAGAVVFFYSNVYTVQIMLTEFLPFASAWKKSRQTIAVTRPKTARWVFKCLGAGVIVLLGTVCCSTFSVWVLKTIQNPVSHTSIATVLFLCNLLLSLVGTCFLKVLYIWESDAVYFTAHPLPHDFCTWSRKPQVPVGLQVTACLLAILIMVGSLAVLWVFGEAGRVAIMAHRGSSVEALENTEPAFQLAMDEGAKYLELDVVETKDHAVVILHDLDLVRLAGLDQRVSDLTLREVQQLSIHSSDGTKNGRIMTLRELLPLIEPNVILNIEIKPDGLNDIRMAQEVEWILSEFPRHMVCSFSPSVLKEIKERNPQRQTGLIIDHIPVNVEQVGFVDFYSIEHSLISPELVRAIHQMDKQVFIWTVNHTALLPTYVSYGVDGIITDVPNEMKKAILSASLTFNRHALERLFLS